MISYNKPVCPLTENRANLFCYSDNCTQPAFACTSECLDKEGHSKHKIAMWSGWEQEIRRLIELPISKEVLQELGRQDKQIETIVGEIKAIQVNHSKTIVEYNKRLQLKNKAKKVIQAIKNKTTNQVTGDDMARLINAIEEKDLFKNKKAVNKAIEQRNQLINKTITKLNNSINKYKQIETDLLKPSQMPKDDFTKIIPMVDTHNSSMTVFDNDIFTVQTGSYAYHPIFAREQLAAEQSYEVEIVDAANRWFKIGVATASLRSQKDQFDEDGSLCVWAFDGTLHSDGRQQINKFRINTGDRITVKNSSEQIEWLRDGELLCATPIPNHIRGTPLFPVLWIQSFNSSEHISKLRFV